MKRRVCYSLILLLLSNTSSLYLFPLRLSPLFSPSACLFLFIILSVLPLMHSSSLHHHLSKAYFNFSFSSCICLFLPSLLYFAVISFSFCLSSYLFFLLIDYLFSSAAPFSFLHALHLLSFLNPYHFFTLTFFSRYFLFFVLAYSL